MMGSDAIVLHEVPMRASLPRRHLLAGASALPLLPRSAWAATPRRGGRLTVAADSEPANLNPAIIASNGVFFVASKVIEPLAEASYDGPFGLAPRLATGWTAAEDGRSISFALRQGVAWHDGKPFTSADVAFSAMEVWKKLQNLGRAVFRNLEAVETPDAHTAVFRFAAPTPQRMIMAALPALTAVLPRHVYEGTDMRRNPANRALVGTGPFRMAETRPGEYTRLVRNPAYREEGRPYLDEIVYRVLPDRAAAANALEAEEIQLAAFSAVPLADLDRIAKVPGLKVYSNGYEGLTYQLVVEINHRRKELSDVRVRRALAHAIDRDFVVRTIFRGYAATSQGPVPKHDRVFHAPEVAGYGFNPARANALLDEAGYPRGTDGVRFRLRLLPAPFFNETRQFGDYLRQALAAVGIEAQIVGNDSAGHQRAVYTDHAFDITVGSPVYRGDPAISTTILFQSGLPPGVPFANQYGYANPEVDALIRQAAGTIDDAERVRLYRALQKQVVDDVALINVAEFSFITVARDNLVGVSNNPRWAVSSWADLGFAG
jgi:peptide/nickel transport system substrate-binding protein